VGPDIATRSLSARAEPAHIAPSLPLRANTATEDGVMSDAPGVIDADLALLTGGSAGELMTTVLTSVGGRLLGWTATQVDHQPGRRAPVSYLARVRWAGASVTGELGDAIGGLAPPADSLAWRAPMSAMLGAEGR
jgi:hypothetical protein